MRMVLLVSVAVALEAVPALAQDVPPQYLNVTNTDGSLESSWAFTWPSAGPDCVNSRYDGLSGRPIAGVALGSVGFSSDVSYPMAGLFEANWVLDPTGNTPDLSSGTSAGPVNGGNAIFNYVFGSFAGNVVIGSEPQHVVCEIVDRGWSLTVGIDDDTSTLFSGWTNDGYATRAYGGFNFGLNAVGDAIAELKALPGGCHSYLHQYLSWTDETGDLTSMT
ncbi:MAG: hypothetical protein AB1486_18340, partial [Planctomycetota bacterium]